MPTPLVVVYWLWFAASIVIVARRIVRKFGRRSAPASEWPRPASQTPTPMTTDDAVVDTTALNESSSMRGTRPASTIAEVLHGISLPCNLAPLTDGSTDFVRRAAFATTTHPAEIVGPAVADELERIGMDFKMLTDTIAVARRDDHVVRVGVREVTAITNLPNAKARAARDFDAPRSVVVEFELT
jgi:hypothetical protein